MKNISSLLPDLKILKNIFKNTDLCFSAYNKKQEFYGGFLEIKNINCKSYNEKVTADAYSKIIIENEL